MLRCPVFPNLIHRQAHVAACGFLVLERSHQRMDVWPTCLHRLETEVSQEDVLAWLKPLQSSPHEDALLLFAPNTFVRDEVRDRFLPRIRELARNFGGIEAVVLSVGAPPRPVIATPPPEPLKGSGTPAEEPFRGNLDSHYVFENFVEGRSNQLARAAAWSVAQKPGERTQNPLLLYGGTGLGKTHLMFAAGNEMRRLNPAAKVLYLRSNDFYSAFFRALQEKRADQFKRQFQKIDALLIDDIQFFAGKDRTQEEFFHTFNALFDGKQQIIMTCDRYPREVEGLEARLKSRLGWGLSVAIDPPDFETRAQIVLSKARERGTVIPNEVAQLIAKKMRSNVRELEGAINKLTAQAGLLGRPVTLEFAQDTLRDLWRAQQQAISIQNIQKAVADYYSLNLREMLGKSRKLPLVRPRQMAMALAKELTEQSLPAIGEAFDGRDHTTVLHACERIRELRNGDSQLHEDWEKLIRKLSE